MVFVLRVTAMLAGWFVMLQFLDHVAGEAKKGFDVDLESPRSVLLRNELTCWGMASR